MKDLIMAALLAAALSIAIASAMSIGYRLTGGM